jgi:hypothetical protein|tara:strand:- start:2607 stop:2771 length:165 start_codon:yes stop_codon:yes gene_type:complete
MEIQTEEDTAKFYLDLAVAKSRAYKNAMREADNEASRLLQMELADKLGIRWFVV